MLHQDDSRARFRFRLTSAASGAVLCAGLGVMPAFAQASLFEARDVPAERFVLVAAPIGTGERAQLNIYEQVKDTRACFATSGAAPAQVEPLLGSFDFTGICSRYIDGNGYSLRVGGDDLATVYRLSVIRQGGDTVLLAAPTKAGAGPELVVARSGGQSNGFLQLVFEPGWKLMRRHFSGRPLGHVYVYRDAWPGSAAEVAPPAGAAPAAPATPSAPVPTPALAPAPVAAPEAPVAPAAPAAPAAPSAPVAAPASATPKVPATPSAPVPTPAPAPAPAAAPAAPVAPAAPAAPAAPPAPAGSSRPPGGAAAATVPAPARSPQPTADAGRDGPVPVAQGRKARRLKARKRDAPPAAAVTAAPSGATVPGAVAVPSGSAPPVSAPSAAELRPASLPPVIAPATAPISAPRSHPVSPSRRF